MRNTTVIGALFLVAGCLSGPDPMGQFGEEEDLECEETSRAPVLPDDLVELGDPDAPDEVLVSDVLALGSGTTSETIRWSDDTEAGGTATLSGATSPETVTYEHTSSGFETEPVPWRCPTRLEFDVDVVLTTDDGRMDDVFVGHGASSGVGVYVEHRITAPGGTIDVGALAAEGVDVEPSEVRVEISLSTGTEPFSGTLLPQPIGGFDDDATLLGRWPVGIEEE